MYEERRQFEFRLFLSYQSFREFNRFAEEIKVLKFNICEWIIKFLPLRSNKMFEVVENILRKILIDELWRTKEIEKEKKNEREINCNERTDIEEKCKSLLSEILDCATHKKATRLGLQGLVYARNSARNAAYRKLVIITRDFLPFHGSGENS